VSDKKFLSGHKQLEEKITEWKCIAGKNMKVNFVTQYTGQRVYAITISDFSFCSHDKKVLYISQPHAHEPAGTAGMIDVIEQLLTGKDTSGNTANIDIEKTLKNTVLTFNPIGNPQGRDRSPVPFFDGTIYKDNEFYCIMYGEDPENPGKRWKRVDLWDVREEKSYPEFIGIGYEQLDEYRYAEPNRYNLSSHMKLFYMHHSEYNYKYWLDLHQTEFKNSNYNAMVYLPSLSSFSPITEAGNYKWAGKITSAWLRMGINPKDPAPLNATGQQAEYFKAIFGGLNKSMHTLLIEVKNNTLDFPPLLQMEAHVSAIKTSINMLLTGGLER